MTKAKINPDDLVAASRDGLSITQAADRFGVSRTAIRTAERRNSVTLPRPGKDGVRFGNDYRAAVLDMRPIDAVEFLLEVIDNLRETPNHDWRFENVHLTRCERQLVYAMATRAPRILTRDGAIAAIMAGREADDPPDGKVIDVFLCKLRKKLAGLSIVITTHHRIGWTIAAPTGFTWPWEA